MRPLALALLLALRGQEEVVVRPEAVDDVLPNPFKGFCAYASSFHADPRIPQTLVYDDVTWAQLEPKARGSIEWSALEGDWERHVRLGRRVGFRFKVADPWTRRGADIPDWLAALGVPLRDYEIDGGKGKAPDWDHPVFLEEHDRIVAEIGKRYARDPRVAWIDVGTYGFWGEWHVHKNPKLAATEASKRRILEAWHKAFPDARRVIAFDDPFATRYVTERGGGVRNDCLGRPEENQWYLDSLNRISPDLVGELFKRAPVTGEFCGAEKGAREALLKRFDATLAFVEKTHWSWIGPAGGGLVGADGELLERARRLHKKLGYRFRVAEVRHPAAAKAGGTLALRATVVNDGVAPFYFPWPAALALVDVDGNVRHEAEIADAAWDCRTWLPGERTLDLSLKLPLLAAGTYAIRLSIRDPDSRKPALRFAMKGGDVHLRYLLGTLRVD